MTTPRFYHPAPLSPAAPGATLDLPGALARHACRVLRLGESDLLTLFDGRGGEYQGRIAAVSRARVAVELLEWRNCERESRLPITLIQALQTGDKMDATVQKAVELGVARIVPVRSRRSVLRLDGERAARRVAHWRAVVVAACEQCGRNRLPVVEEIVDLEAWLNTLPVSLSAPSKSPAPHAYPESFALRLCLSPTAERTLSALPPPAMGAGVELLIGAEGGLTAEEMALAARAGFHAVRLGPRVLRTETAGMAAVAAMQAVWGDFAD